MTKKDSHTEKMKNYYDKLYSKKNYWGEDPSPLSLILFSEYIKQRTNLSLLDIGCGQGADSIYFGKKGFEVTAIDISKFGLDNLEENAKQNHVDKQIKTFAVDIKKIQDLPSEDFTVVFSRMALQMIEEKNREKYVNELKQKYSNSIHAHIIPISGACFGTDFICSDELLKESYKDWNILFYDEVHTISRSKNKNGEPYLMKEAWIICKKN